MYTIEGVSGVANFITAYDEIKPRIPPHPTSKLLLTFRKRYFLLIII